MGWIAASQQDKVEDQPLVIVTRFILFIHGNIAAIFFFEHNFSVKPYLPREPRRDPSNRRLNEHGIYIRHCQESNSQPILSQAGANPTRPQWQTMLLLANKLLLIGGPCWCHLTSGVECFNQTPSLKFTIIQLFQKILISFLEFVVRHFSYEPTTIAMKLTI